MNLAILATSTPDVDVQNCEAALVIIMHACPSLTSPAGLGSFTHIITTLTFTSAAGDNSLTHATLVPPINFNLLFSTANSSPTLQP